MQIIFKLHIVRKESLTLAWEELLVKQLETYIAGMMNQLLMSVASSTGSRTCCLYFSFYFYYAKVD